MIGALKAAAVLALAGSSLAAPAAVARSSIPSAGNELASRQVVISPKVMIISMVRTVPSARRFEGWGGAIADLLLFLLASSPPSARSGSNRWSSRSTILSWAPRRFSPTSRAVATGPSASSRLARLRSTLPRRVGLLLRSSCAHDRLVLTLETAHSHGPHALDAVRPYLDCQSRFCPPPSRCATLAPLRKLTCLNAANALLSLY